MIETLTIDHLGRAGDGVAKTDKGPVYIAGTLPGEIIRAEIHGMQGLLLDILTPSPDRVAPLCRHAEECGGCTLQHMNKEVYLNWKEQLVRTELERHGLECEVGKIIAVEPRTRRRVALSFKAAKHGVRLGFYRSKSQEILAPRECPLLEPKLEAALIGAQDQSSVTGPFAALAGSVVRAKREERLVAQLGKGGISVEMSGRAPSGRNQVEELWKRSAPFWKVMLNGELAGADAGDDTIDVAGHTLTTPPGVFLQAVPKAEAALIAHASSHLGACKQLLDLFAGIGTFTLPLAKIAKVTAIEGNRQAVEALKHSAARNQGLKSITAQRRDLFKHPLSTMELNRFDGALFDPPRAGAEAQCRQLAASKVSRIAAISCNPVTFARDAKILVAGGYRLTHVLPVDQFLWSGHVELSAHFER